ncbi:MAG TPA: GH3 auxin-responsive promoter family protein, partial [Bacteroidia bacterium]|nr:GH3 auxin-responsive promoter family protein [Bacteroidia bacterium]
YAETVTLDQVEIGKNYAMVITTNAGLWRYNIGDTVKFTSISPFRIRITGRTKHFLSLCGEHLSVENMSKAISFTAEQMGIEINEFAVAGIPHGNLFAHHWYIGSNMKVSADALREKIDEHLKVINDDYRVERTSALKEVIVTVLPDDAFIDFLASKGKLGSAHKFPRVMKGKQLEEWQEFIKKYQA